MPSVIATNANPVEKAPAETSKELAEAMEAVEIMMNVRNRSIQFVKDESSGANVIKVIDDNTGEVIRQLPSEELLGFMRNLTKMLGNFLDERV
jgi:flagellar protein FlaG|tara:strand:+ start:1285 stop:1563 length:279 start_codon:yes stop_codon:yes gene_type:complete